MPVMNGVEFARRLKKGNPDAKIIISSGKIERSDEFALTSVGILERLWKPYRADQLLKAIYDKIHGLTPDLARHGGLSS
jgi:CheY-like chemotaxis protein